ncbi:putative reverse transcriptase domain-containing protein, partial [Tanacetum coccineum]
MADFLPGRAVINAAQRKRDKYMDKCAAMGYGFLPFSFSSVGELEADAISLLKRIRKFFMTRDIGARAVVHIFNRFSFAIAKGPCSAYLRLFAEDIYGDHDVSCAGIIGIKHRHNLVRDTLVDICYRSGISAGNEVDIGLDGARDKPLRPLDMVLYSWDGGLDVCVDLTGSSPLTQTGMVDFVPGRAVIDAAQRKREADAVTLLKRIRKFSMAQDIGARVVVHIFNRISFAIAKGPVHASCLVSFNEWIKIECGTQVRKFYNLMDPADGIQTEPHYWPTSISPDPKIALVVLFERVLTYADQDIGFDYIRIPMIHAEAYLPKAIQSYAKYKFCIFDWDYNCWNVTISRVDKELHIIEGLKQYMISNNLKAGDTVTFYRLVPDGQYAISFRNAERRNHLL